MNDQVTIVLIQAATSLVSLAKVGEGGPPESLTKAAAEFLESQLNERKASPC